MTTPAAVLPWTGGGYLREVPLLAGVARLNDWVRDAHSYRGPNELSVLVTLDDTPKWGPLRHVSIAYARKDPSWAEIKRVRALFFAVDQDVMMVLPRASDYVNLHEHAFHLWQTPQGWEIQ